MSLITYRIWNSAKHPAVSGQALRTFVMPTIVRPIRKAVASATKLLLHAIEAIAEARMQRAKIEAELYRNRYKYSSKNDDDLPVIR
jgi:hypothetical protein